MADSVSPKRRSLPTFGRNASWVVRSSFIPVTGVLPPQPFLLPSPLLASIELMAETFKIAFCVSYLVVLGDLVRDAVGSENPPTNTMNTIKKKMPTLRFQSGEDLQLYRRKHGMNQGEFWGKVGVTQSGGSRYESGRNVPKPVQILLHITYGTPKESEKLVGWLRDK